MGGGGVRAQEPFLADDLAALDGLLLSRADAVVPMCDIAAGNSDPRTIGLRHDVDNVFQPALEMARWEAERGYRSTYFILHDSPYWDDPGLQAGLEEMVELGHEVGIHTNAIAVALRTGRDPVLVLAGAVERLRAWGHPCRGVVGHGDSLCYAAGFVNDELFSECARPEMGAPDRTLVFGDVRLPLAPVPLSTFGFEYESYRCGPRAAYLSDSGGRWNVPFADAAAGFPYGGQLHMLIHADWWGEAFTAAGPLEQVTV